MEEKRITVQQLYNLLGKLISDGDGDRFISIDGESYLSKRYGLTGGEWNDIWFDSLSHDEVNLTDKQKEWLKFFKEI